MVKRGQLNQVFVYIFIIIVAAMILLFGYQSVVKVTKTGEDVEFIKFKTDFEKEVSKYYYLAEGSSKNVEMRLNGKVKEICFVGENRDVYHEDEEIQALIKALEDKNMFFVMIGNNERLSPLYIEHLEPAYDLVCIKVSLGILKFKLTTKRDYVEIGELPLHE